MKSIITLLILFSFLGCKNPNEVLGHWHIFKEGAKTDDYIVMDVTADTIAYLGKNSIHGLLEGVHRKKKRELFFPGDCGVFMFKYELRGDKIYLKNDLGNYIGERCGKGCCDKLIDFKSDLKVEVDFPTITLNRDSQKPSEFLDERRMEELVIGYPKQRFDIFYENKIRLELDGKFAEISHISKWVELVTSRYQEAVKSRITFRIMADKHVPFEYLALVIAELRKNRIKRILLTCLKENFHEEENMFEYVLIEKVNFDTTMTIEEVIK